MRALFTFTLSLSLLCALSFAPRVLADGKSKDSTAYTEAVRVGLQEFEDKNFAEARAHFTRAHALAPSARTLRALGMVEFELKHYAESVRLLSEALASHDRPLDADKRVQSQELLARAEGYIGAITLDIEPQTTVLVDGVNTTVSSGNELVLEVGDHALEFQSPGHIGQKRTLTIRGGEHSTLHVELIPLGGARRPSATPSDEPSSLPSSGSAPAKERRALKSPWLWAAVGLVVAGAATGAAIAFTRDPGTKTREPYPGTGGAPALGAPR